MPIVVVLVVVLAWFIFSSPKNDVAGFFWPDDAAPWETVDAFYYPDRSNLIDYTSMRGFASVDECRFWVNAAAAGNNDPGLLRGDYECAVGKLTHLGELTVYRLTLR